MKLRNKIMIVVSTLVVVAAIFIVVNQKNKTNEAGNSTKSNLNQEASVEEKLKIDETDGNIEESSIITNGNEGNQENGGTSTPENDSVENGKVSMSGETTQTEVQTQVEVQTPAEDAALTNSGETNTTTAPAAGTNTSGLHFSSREEAIAFGMSRLSAEEIALYNKAAARGLTPEQEQLAIQMAYSRFSAEEIAAIEEALSR